ncbi:MAG: hypothetical protein ACPK7O_00420 [Methanobacterium sp.]
MVDIKEIKSAKIVPFTLMSSSISAILAFIGAIIFSIIIAASLGIISQLIPQQFAPVVSALAGFSVTAIIAYPIITFLVSLSTVFLSVLLYNILAPRVGGVKLGMDGNRVAEIPIVPFALILSIIMAIWAFIIGLLIATSITPLLGLVSTALPILTNGTATGVALGTGSAIFALIMIIGLPILVFIFAFIGHALFAIFYNYIATRVSEIQLNFDGVAEKWHALIDIPIVPIALALAVISAIFALIQGILNIGAAPDIVSGIIALILNIIVNFIWTFIVVAIATFLYNFLVPRIGAVKLALE